MKADLTRNTLNLLKHYALVLTQQGRVSLDSDSNEQAAILLHYLQTLGADLIGPAGGPDANAFSISAIGGLTGDFRIGLGRYYVAGIPCEAESEVIQVSATGKPNEALVPQWTLDGKLFDQDQLVELFDDVMQPLGDPQFDTVASITNASQANRKLTLSATPAATIDLTKGTNPSVRRVLTYLTQPDYPQPEPLAQTKGNNGAYLAYLDVWTRHITYIEDPSIREAALGGPDTATRAKIVWQVKVTKGQFQSNDKPCDGFKPDDPDLLLSMFGPNHGRLKARAQQNSTPTDPCIIPPDANYHGEENQLYRVEVHTPGAANVPSPTLGAKRTGNKLVKLGATGSGASGATFKWSRENGSVTFPIVGSITTGDGVTTLKLANLGRDDRFGLKEGNWVEIQDDDYVLLNHAGTLLQVQSVDRTTMEVTLTGTADTGVGDDQSKHPLLRRWDHQQGDPAEGGLTLGPDNAALIQENDGSMWLELEDGVQIQFQPAPGATPHQYRTGDYWLIPARTATADVEWPRETVPDAQGNLVTSPLSKAPDGIKHYYAPLGVFQVANDGTIKPVADKTGSCHKQFTALTKK